MSEIRICKYCGMELLEDVPHGLRNCHLRAVARIAELEEKQRWIPVSERLPEEGEQVWATDGCHIWVPEFYQKWGGECLSFGAIDDLVTHWLPCSWLPELPEVTE